MSKSRGKMARVPVAAVALFAIMSSGCSGNPAKTGAENYLNNLKLFNYPGCYQALSHQDQVDRTLEQFLGNIPMAQEVKKD